MGKDCLTSKDRNFILVIVLISIALVASLVLNVIVGFYSKNNIIFSYEVGDDFVLRINSIGAYSNSFALSGDSLPCDRVKQKFVIVLPDRQYENVVLRAKANILDYAIKLSGFDDWVLDEQDNYYYYSGVMYANQNVGLCTEIEWENIELRPNIVYMVEFTIEYLYLQNLA